jgi:hypothetical protein
MEPRLWMVYFKKDNPAGHRLEQINGRIIVAAANPEEAEEVARPFSPYSEIQRELAWEFIKAEEIRAYLVDEQRIIPLDRTASATA